ncbi:hypothetical protein YC2023_078574 [Brassica napus]
MEVEKAELQISFDIIRDKHEESKLSGKEYIPSRAISRRGNMYHPEPNDGYNTNP